MAAPPLHPGVFADLTETFAGIRSELPLQDEDREKLIAVQRLGLNYLQMIGRLLAVDMLVRSGVEITGADAHRLVHDA